MDTSRKFFGWFRFNKKDALFIYDKISSVKIWEYVSRNWMKFIFVSGHCSSYWQLLKKKKEGEEI